MGNFLPKHAPAWFQPYGTRPENTSPITGVRFLTRLKKTSPSVQCEVPTVSNSFFRKFPLQLLLLFCEGSSLFVQILLHPSLKCFSECRHHRTIRLITSTYLEHFPSRFCAFAAVKFFTTLCISFLWEHMVFQCLFFEKKVSYIKTDFPILFFQSGHVMVFHKTTL